MAIVKYFIIQDNSEAMIYAGCNDKCLYGISKGSDKKVILNGHTYIFINNRASITAVALTIDNKYIVSGAINGEIFVWDKLQNKNLKSFHIHTTPITNLIPINRPRNLYGLNANMEHLEKMPLPEFEK